MCLININRVVMCTFVVIKGNGLGIIDLCLFTLTLSAKLMAFNLAGGLLG